MPDLYTVRILRPCVCNRAPREVGDVVKMVPQSEKQGLVNSRKGEVIDSIDAAIVAADKRAKTAEAKADADADAKPVSKKAAKKAAKKGARK
mgnify:CR=1 FL=1